MGKKTINFFETYEKITEDMELRYRGYIDLFTNDREAMFFTQTFKPAWSLEDIHEFIRVLPVIIMGRVNYDTHMIWSIEYTKKKVPHVHLMFQCAERKRIPKYTKDYILKEMTDRDGSLKRMGRSDFQTSRSPLDTLGYILKDVVESDNYNKSIEHLRYLFVRGSLNPAPPPPKEDVFDEYLYKEITCEPKPPDWDKNQEIIKAKNRFTDWLLN